MARRCITAFEGGASLAACRLSAVRCVGIQRLPWRGPARAFWNSAHCPTSSWHVWPVRIKATAAATRELTLVDAHYSLISIIPARRLPNQALDHALEARGSSPDPLLHQSDPGYQYTSAESAAGSNYAASPPACAAWPTAKATSPWTLFPVSAFSKKITRLPENGRFLTVICSGLATPRSKIRVIHSWH